MLFTPNQSTSKCSWLSSYCCNKTITTGSFYSGPSCFEFAFLIVPSCWYCRCYSLLMLVIMIELSNNTLISILSPGYKPCDPQVIRDRVQHLDLCYQELCALAAQRKARLEQSRRFWNFLWEVAELDSWIREKEHIFSSLDYGKDLTSVLVLQSKHSAFEDELGARRANLEQVLVEGEKMIQAKHFGSPKVQECSDNIGRQWQQLEELAAFRKQNLQDTQRFFQFQGDADDLKSWLLDTKRQMSSDDVGHDEYTTQLLLKKHNNLKNEALKNGATIDALSKQASALPEELQNTPDIQRRLKDIKDLYMELLSLADLRQKRLDDTMALYTIFSETDACELWMGQKETWLVGLEVPEKLEDLEVVQNRYTEEIILFCSPGIFL